MADRQIKVLLGKAGLDGHDRGIKAVAAWLRREGMEVIYIGTHNTPESVVATAVQEDVDVIGMSFQGGDHEHILEQVQGEMDRNGLNHVLLIVGGNIPRQHDARLKEIGVDMIFHAGTSMGDIVDFIMENAGRSAS